MAERGAQFGKGGGGADHQCPVLDLAAPQLRHPADADQVLEARQALGDVQSEVGAPGHQLGPGVAAAQLDQCRQAGGGVETGSGRRRQAGVAAAVHGQDRIPGRISQAPGRVPGGVRLPLLDHRLLAGRHDRAVSGAAAEVAGQRLKYRRSRRRLPSLMGVQGNQRHHDAGGAKAALGGVLFDHGLLHGVARGLLERFQSDQVTAVQAADQGDAAVDGFVAHVARRVRRAHDDGAGAAVAGTAALLGGGEPHFGAQPCQDAQIWVSLVKFLELPVQRELNHSRLHYCLISGGLQDGRSRSGPRCRLNLIRSLQKSDQLVKSVRFPCRLYKLAGLLLVEKC